MTAICTENLNELARQCFAKKTTNFTQVTDAEVADVERKFNNRPRKRLSWLTPAQGIPCVFDFHWGVVDFFTTLLGGSEKASEQRGSLPACLVIASNWVNPLTFH
jgi:hypothetical protein